MKTALAYKFLWLRYCWWFAWAHKPLCLHFRQDVLCIGTLRLCRSCTAAYGVGLAGALALWLYRFNPEYVSVLYGSVLPITLTLSWPPVYKRLPRINRDVLRAALGALIPATVYIALFGNLYVACAGAGCLALFWKAAGIKRQQHKLRKCEGCPEWSSQRACSGYTQQLLSIRHFQDEAVLVRIKHGGMPPRIQSQNRRYE